MWMQTDCKAEHDQFQDRTVDEISIDILDKVDKMIATDEFLMIYKDFDEFLVGQSWPMVFTF